MNWQLLTQYARHQHRRNLRRSTIDGQRRTIKAFLSWLGDDVSALDASPADVEKWLDACALAPRSRYTYLATLVAFYAWAISEGLTTENPAKDVLRPRLPRLIPRPVSPTDVDYAIAQADPMMQAWLCLAAFQGFRCIEIATQRREDVLDHATPPMLVVSDGKGGHQAVLPLHEYTRRALLPFLGVNHGHLFTMADGSPWKRGTVSVYIAKYLKGLGIPASAHRLRHYYGTQVYALSHDIRLTQELMRHADPKTTAIYAAWNPSDAVDVINRLGQRATDR